MELAEVRGSVTATVKSASLRSHKLLVVAPLRADGTQLDRAEVAIDTVGAGVGERVLLVRGSGARQPPETRSVAADLTIVAIVDTVDLYADGSRATSRPSHRRST